MQAFPILAALLVLATHRQEGQNEPVQGHIRVNAKFAYVKVAMMTPGTSGWIRADEVVVDEQAYCWIKADAKVRSDDASATGIQVHRRKDGGWGLAITGKPDWEVQRRDNFLPGMLVPCTSWKVSPLELEAPPETPKKKPKIGIEDKGVL